jgi:predicted alpha/beta-fold hydrolase
MLPHFRPHPLFRGGHAQTIAGCYLPGMTIVERATRHCVPLPDGDQIVLHEDGPDCHALQNGHSQNAGKVVLLVHGLGGSHRSGYLQRCMHKLTSRGIRVYRMDLRGCGAGIELARFPVHAGRSEDVGAAIDFVLARHPDARLCVVGFSMGANMVLKLLGERGNAVSPRLLGAMAVAPPIDLVECSRTFRRGLGWLYDRAFIAGLLRSEATRRRQVPEGHHLPRSARPRRLREFDEVFTAPIGGFGSAEEYYCRSSSGPVLSRIGVPSLIVAAADDPIVPIGPFERASYAPHTKLAVLPTGGHLGFIGIPKIDPDRRWLDWRILEWGEGLGARQ